MTLKTDKPEKNAGIAFYRLHFFKTFKDCLGSSLGYDGITIHVFVLFVGSKKKGEIQSNFFTFTVIQLNVYFLV